MPLVLYGQRRAHTISASVVTRSPLGGGNRIFTEYKQFQIRQIPDRFWDGDNLIIVISNKCETEVRSW